MNPKFALTLWVERIDQLPTRSAVSIITLVSLLVKFGYVFFLGGGLDAFPKEGSDAIFYYGAAQVLLKFGVFGMNPTQPSLGMPPGETYFLALLSGLSNDSIGFMKFAHVALLTLVAVITYLTGKELISPMVGFGAGILTAIDPGQAYLGGTFLSDPLFIFMMAIGIYAIAKYQTRPRLGWLIGAGVSIGLAGLTRNQGWLIAVALWLGALITVNRLISLRAATVVLLVTVITIAPWALRNYFISGEVVPIAANGGLNLWSGNNPEFLWKQPMPMSLPLYESPPNLSEVEVDQYYSQRAIEWIVAHPLNFALNDIRKVIMLYNFDPASARPEMIWLFRVAGFFPYGLMFPFILIGLLRSWHEQRLWLLYLYILFTTFICIVFWGDSRLRAPIQPYLYVFGVIGIQIATRWFLLRSQQSFALLHIKRSEG